jgi:hypothetical protein
MSTVTALADRVCAVSGLATTSTDRTKVLEYLNEAYQTTVMEAGGYIGTFSKSLTSGTADYTIGTAPLDVTDLLEIRALWVTDSSAMDRPLRQIPEFEMNQLRQATTVPSALPLYYAMRGTSGLLLYPTPGTGTTLEGSYLKSPLTLVESSPVAGTSESTPTAFPAAFHFPVLANKAISLALEYDNRFEEAANYDAKWGVAMERLLAWVSRMPGPTLTSLDNTGFEGPRDMDRI